MPPRAAFNKATFLLGKIVQAHDSAEIRWKFQKKQGGNFRFVTCEKCNNHTGGCYGSHYVSFVRQCAPLATPENTNKRLEFDIQGLKLLYVAKQAVAMICAAAEPELTEEWPSLRKFVLNHEQRGIDPGLRLYFYIRALEGGRSSGLAAVGNAQTGNVNLVVEFSWWPVGWILAFRDQSGIDAMDVTDWCGMDTRKQSVILHAPCHFTPTAYPLDFRSPEQFKREMRDRNGERGD